MFFLKKKEKKGVEKKRERKKAVREKGRKTKRREKKTINKKYSYRRRDLLLPVRGADEADVLGGLNVCFFGRGV